MGDTFSNDAFYLALMQYLELKLTGGKTGAQVLGKLFSRNIPHTKMSESFSNTKTKTFMGEGNMPHKATLTKQPGFTYKIYSNQSYRAIPSPNPWVEIPVLTNESEFKSQVWVLSHKINELKKNAIH